MATSSRLKLEVEVGLMPSPLVLSTLKLPWPISASELVMLNLIFLSSSEILGAGLLPSISSGGRRYPRRLNVYPFLFKAGGMVWQRSQFKPNFRANAGIACAGCGARTAQPRAAKTGVRAGSQD